ncbi:MAG: COX15/CtaA family protein [Deltaproteobacteria bacterium]|nr:COX15/CtaA family protein [Deltaproteobacteria bacterium]
MKRLLSFTIFTTFFLFLWGATVRSTGTGLGCPDWPLCLGKVIPPISFPVIMEWGHRLLASLVGFLTLSIVMVAFTKYRRELGKLSIVAFVLLLIQASLGGAAILTFLSPYVISIHLGVGTLFLSTLLWMRLRLHATDAFARFAATNAGGETPPPTYGRLPHPVAAQEQIRLLLFIALTFVFLQTLLGGMVASSHAGLACPDFPTCFGNWIPELSGLVALQFWHRVGAVLVSLAVCLTLIAFFSQKHDHPVKPVFIGIGIVTALQFLLGVSNVLLGLPVVLRVAHLGGATLLYSLLFIAVYEVRRVRSAS